MRSVLNTKLLFVYMFFTVTSFLAHAGGKYDCAQMIMRQHTSELNYLEAVEICEDYSSNAVKRTLRITKQFYLSMRFREALEVANYASDNEVNCALRITWQYPASVQFSDALSSCQSQD